MIYPAPSTSGIEVIHLSERFHGGVRCGDKFNGAFSVQHRGESRQTARRLKLHVIVIAPNPNYTVDPELFPDQRSCRPSAGS